MRRVKAIAGPTYEYDALDRLARNVYYNSIGTNFNGTEYSNLTWTQGRRLSSITKDSQTYSYEYDMSGAQREDCGQGTAHKYVTQNDRVIRDYASNLILQERRNTILLFQASMMASLIVGYFIGNRPNRRSGVFRKCKSYAGCWK